MTLPPLDLERAVLPLQPRRNDHAIGVVGAGFIVRDVQLVAYREAGFPVAALASRDPARARAVAAEHGVPRVHDTVQALLEDPSLTIIDIAVPPHVQLDVVRAAVRQPHVKGILAQKPLAPTLGEATEIVTLCERAGVTLAVNQNMRFDHGIRALHALLRRGELGESVLATLEMRAVPHWQAYLRDYERLTVLNMSVHHLDAFRFLFGDPERVFASARSDPRTAFPHRDGIVLYVLEYEGGLRASAWDDVWAGPGAGETRDDAIGWRVEGTEGMAQGTIGWPRFPERAPSTIDYVGRTDVTWQRPRWPYAWFPDAFAGPMAHLMRAIEDGGPTVDVDGRDNLKTMALVEACYRSLDEHRAVRLDEIPTG